MGLAKTGAKRMLNENVQKWVDALRSGKYARCQGFLQDGSGYCCLGVAARLWLDSEIESGWDVSQYLVGGVIIGTSLDNNNSAGVDLSAVARWLGMNSGDGGFYFVYRQNSGNYYREWNSLQDLNDDSGYTFDQIAEVIASDPSGLFKNEIAETGGEK